jgi:hypothetical protein
MPGADVGARSRQRNSTALHYAASAEYVPTSGAVAALLAAGADPAAVDARGRTPLDNAREALEEWQALSRLGIPLEPPGQLEAWQAIVRELAAAQAAARRCGLCGRRGRVRATGARAGSNGPRGRSGVGGLRECAPPCLLWRAQVGRQQG